MDRKWVRLFAVALTLVVGLTAVALFGSVSSAPAGNRNPLSQLAVIPGLEEVSFGQNVALNATLVNRQKSTFTDVRFRAPIPEGVTFQSTNCEQFQLIPEESPTEFVCDWGHQLRAGETATVAFVLKTPASGSSTVTFSGAWVIKEGSAASGSPDTFPTNDVDVSLIAANDPNKARGYAIAVCNSPSTPTIATNPAVDLSNPLATSVCVPNLPLTTLGLVTGVEERNHTPPDPGVTQVSEICLPAPTFGCDPGYTPFVFSSLATFTFVISNASLPSGEKIDKVFHDGAVVSKSSTADPRVVSIKIQKFKGITTVVAQSSTNGSWTFG